MPAQGHQDIHGSTTLLSPTSIYTFPTSTTEASVLTRRVIGKRIRARRQHLGLSQEALAAVAGVSRETIRRLEAGRITSNLETFGKVADGLRISASALLAERASDELTDLMLRLPGRERQNMIVMLRALSDHLADTGR
jgi:transcriptional regulator with XRE-family HTH domain